MKERCVVIPALKKHAVIPDQLVKKLAGETLIARALNTARACVPGEDIITLTDSEEIALVCSRAGARYSLDPSLRFRTWNLLAETKDFLTSLLPQYRRCVILRPSCPLLTWVDVEDAYRNFAESDADCLISVKNVRQRLWKRDRDSLRAFLENIADETEETGFVIETRALVILNLDILLHPDESSRVMPWFLDERSLEIEDYQDWWICERLLERRHAVFVVAGYPAIGMGHVYRALMLAHEITSHKISFVCTRESELAAASVAARDYRVYKQGEEPLWQTVAALKPDLVINDFLNTEKEYVNALLDRGARVVNFEDVGPGADLADLVVNALYDKADCRPNARCGPRYFCLRDEFVHARRNPFREKVSVLLITFGGVDRRDCSRRVLDLTAPICLALGIAIRVVAGPGYAHAENMKKRIAELENPLITFTWATNVMSRMMEDADLAICSAGRTVYELAHMRVPGIVLATHEREATHTFARPRNGFAFAGVMDKVSDRRLRNLFLAMLKQERRARYWERQNRLSFAGNKQRVVGLLEDQLEKARLTE